MNLVNRADAEQAFAELCVSATATAHMRLCNNLDSIWTTFCLTVSNRRHGHDCCLSSFAVSDSTLHDGKYNLRDAPQCIAQMNTTLLHCVLYLMQYV